MNCISGMWSLMALPLPMIVFGSKPIEGAENVNDHNLHRDDRVRKFFMQHIISLMVQNSGSGE